MSDLHIDKQRSGKTVRVSLELDAEVYEFFAGKAKKLGYELEPYIASTLELVTGCRAFSDKDLCAPKTVKIKKV